MLLCRSRYLRYRNYVSFYAASCTNEGLFPERAYHSYITCSVIQSEDIIPPFGDLSSQCDRRVSVNSSEFSSPIMTFTSTRSLLPFVRTSSLEIAHFSLSLRFHPFGLSPPADSPLERTVREMASGCMVQSSIRDAVGFSAVAR